MAKQVKTTESTGAKYKNKTGTVIEINDTPANHAAAKKAGWTPVV